MTWENNRENLAQFINGRVNRKNDYGRKEVTIGGTGIECSRNVVEM